MHDRTDFITDGREHMYKRILVSTDGSKLSDKAIKEAAKIAKLAEANC